MKFCIVPLLSEPETPWKIWDERILQNCSQWRTQMGQRGQVPLTRCPL